MTRAKRTSRARMIDTIRRALGREGVSQPPPPPPPPEVDDALVRLTGAEEDLPALFIERAEANGMEVRRCGSADLPEELLRLLDPMEAKRVSVSLGEAPEAEAVERALRGRGVELVDWRGDRTMDALYGVDAGVSDVAAALAETGTLIRRSGPRSGRGQSLVPPVHVAVVRPGDILPDMLDYFARDTDLSPAELPASQSMITGPSKTADIEGVLITGVHGPGRVIVVLVE